MPSGSGLFAPPIPDAVFVFTRPLDRYTRESGKPGPKSWKSSPVLNRLANSKLSADTINQSIIVGNQR
jgi:hypothetical protein